MLGEGSDNGIEEEPEKLGVLAEIEILKNGNSCEKPLNDMLMPCSLGTVVRDALRLERLGEGEGVAEEKDSAGGVEFWHIFPLANTSSQCPRLGPPM